MSNQWLRLWHDMPNDPKWRTIARISGQPIALVQAVYLHLLVDASRNVTRGHVTVTAEDLASALDVTDEDIEAVLAAMQGRVLDGLELSGWDKRQPKREDQGSDESGAKSATERKREQRQREREARDADMSRQCHDESRDVTLDKDKDKNKPTSLRSVGERTRDTSSGIPVPADLQPDRTSRLKAGELQLDPDAEMERFIAHHQAARSLRADDTAWQAQYRKWLLDQRQFNADRNRVTDAKVQAAQKSGNTIHDQRAAAMDTIGVGQQYLTGGKHAALAS
ncbi:hypothetical protein [Chromobacterium subtsugae]|uniref:hypothetical protein n=1 Tax=Chromobacterium subtsugae TaxID=251747 RepID=UPI0007F8F6F3|nr:hypothetical protein [Chromobacterium subtsugae]